MAELKKQWYEENPELLEEEKVAMETIAKDDDKEFGFLKNGRFFGIGSMLGRIKSLKNQSKKVDKKLDTSLIVIEPLKWAKNISKGEQSYEETCTFYKRIG